MEETTVESLINAAFDAAHQSYPLGHLKGEQIKNHLRLAMVHVNPNAASVLAGKSFKSPKGEMKAKPFPVASLKTDVPEPNFTNAVSQSEDAQLAATEDEKPVDIVAEIVNMKPSTAVERFGINAIDTMLEKFEIIEVGVNENQRAAVLIQFLKKSKKK